MRLAVVCAMALVLSSCAAAEGDDISTTTAFPDDTVDCPVIEAVDLKQTAPGVFTANTTVRSVDIEGVSYADAWEIRDLSGEVLGERVLTHPHANEQPFTRSLSGIAISPDITSVEVAARDSARGFCGPTLIVEVTHS